MDLTHLDNKLLGNNGDGLVEFIRKQGKDPPLRHVETIICQYA